MRKKLFAGLLFLAGTAMILVPASIQGQFGGGKGSKGGGFGGPGGGMMGGDPNAMFEMLSKGRPFFLISEMRRLKDPLTLFAQQKGITNGQITKQQFVEFNEQMTAKKSSGSPVPFSGGSPVSPGVPAAVAQNPDLLNQLADADFKRHDGNGDGKLNGDEMPPPLKNALDKWDANKDGFVDQTEYRVYFIARLQGTDQGDAAKTANPIATIIIEEEDWDRRPTVLRAGKLPKDGMPSWFNELDTDKDGQVALYEWRKGGKPLEEFKTWDTDDDGIITPGEAMKLQALLTKGNSKTGSPGETTAMNFNRGFGGGGSFGNSEVGSSRPPWGGKGNKDGGKDGASPWGGGGGKKKKQRD